MIRLAVNSDIDSITNLARQMFKQSIYSKHEWHEDFFKSLAGKYIAGDKLLAMVYEKDKEVQGFFFANIVGSFYGPPRQATQQLFFIHPMHRGGKAAVTMMKKFEHWGRAMGCDTLCFAQTAFGADDRWQKFCQNLGYTHVGAVFFKGL